MLGKDQILWRAKTDKLVDPLKQSNIQGSSYDLRLGSEYYVFGDSKSQNASVSPLEKDGMACIPAYGAVMIITEETVNMPLDLAGQLSLRMGLIRQGVMLGQQPPIEPGSSGKIIALLHNLSSEPVYLRRGTHVLSIAFHDVKRVAITDGYKGTYQGYEELSRYIEKPIKGSLAELHSEIDSLKKGVEQRLQMTLLIVTVILGIITIGAGAFVARQWWSPEQAPPGASPDITQSMMMIPAGARVVTSGGRTVLEIPLPATAGPPVPSVSASASSTP